MTLTKELLDQLLEAAEQRAGAAGGSSAFQPSDSRIHLQNGAALSIADERRRNQRVALAARAMIVRLNRGQPQPPVEVELRDVSTHGVCILHTERLAAGEQFGLRLPREDSTTQWMHCVVVEARPGDGARFSMGCKFTRVIQPAAKAG